MFDDYVRMIKSEFNKSNEIKENLARKYIAHYRNANYPYDIRNYFRY